MSTEAARAHNPEEQAVTPARARGELFLISLLILFLELACIRWFPAHVLLLTFFTNTVLLACFLGMSVGCLAASRPRNYLIITPAVLALAIAAAHATEKLMGSTTKAAVGIGSETSPQVVYFGSEFGNQDVASFVIPLELLGGFFFFAIALAMVGPGQVLGRALGRVPNRVQAYTLNILGSIVGIVLFALCSFLQLSPFWWFLPVSLVIGYFLYERPVNRDLVFRWGLLGLILVGVSLRTGTHEGKTGTREYAWSPYYRIDYDQPPHRRIGVNLIGHQEMVSRDHNISPGYAYALPHLLNRDAQRLAGQEPGGYEDVLIIGAGSGNDVSRALQWGAKHIDAVEIDPVIQKLGERDHPDQPYQDPRVSVHLDDGRNFLRSTDRQYDLILYALVDSLVLHSSYSNIRLESYLFTTQAFEDVKRRLKPGGVFVMYNYYRQGWIVARLQQGLNDVFGTEPIVMTLPYQKTVEEGDLQGGFTVLFAGEGAKGIEEAFAKRGEFWVTPKEGLNTETGDGFQNPTPEERAHWESLSAEEKAKEPWIQFGTAKVVAPDEPLRAATDDWPFLYLRKPMIPDLSLRGAAIMAVIALGMIFWFAPRGQNESKREGRGTLWRMFFLGAAFMLIETKAVVHMALLFGSTWMVNSVVFFAILVMILAANLFVLAVRPEKLWPYFVGLFATLALNVVVPLDFFLGMERTLQVIGSCLLVFTPVLFAGVIFAVSFSRTAQPDRAFGANIAGAMLGGLAEYTSMLLGFQYLVVVAIVLYGLAAAVIQRVRPAIQVHVPHEPEKELATEPSAAS